MAPFTHNHAYDESLKLFARDGNKTFGDWRLDAGPEALILEAWSEGVLLGSLMIMICITIANLRRGVLLHKLILIELFLAIMHGTFCLMDFRGYGWYLSSTAALLYCSYFLHNVIAWIKIKPFFVGQQPFFGPKTCKWVPRIYLSTLALSIPPLIFQIFNNFRYFNNISTLYRRARPYEPLMKDPWWVAVNLVLFHIIRKSYGVGVTLLIRKSPRLGVLIIAICLAIIFTLLDFLSSIIYGMSLTDGINPYWKLSLVFKCLTDSIMLDDFKTELKRITSLQARNASIQEDYTKPSMKNSVAGTVNEIEYVERMSPVSSNIGDGPMPNKERTVQPGTTSSQSKAAQGGEEDQEMSDLPYMDTSILNDT